MKKQVGRKRWCINGDKNSTLPMSWCRGCIDGFGLLWLVFLKGEITAGLVDAVLGHAFVGAEVGAFQGLCLALDFHVGGRVKFAGVLIPVEEGSAESFAFGVFDENAATEFPKVALVEVVGGVAVDESFDVVVGIEFLHEETFLKGPIGRVFLVVHVPVFGDEFVADDA